MLDPIEMVPFKNFDYSLHFKSRSEPHEINVFNNNDVLQCQNSRNAKKSSCSCQSKMAYVI